MWLLMSLQGLGGGVVAGNERVSPLTAPDQLAAESARVPHSSKHQARWTSGPRRHVKVNLNNFSSRTPWSGNELFCEDRSILFVDAFMRWEVALKSSQRSMSETCRQRFGTWQQASVPGIAASFPCIFSLLPRCYYYVFSSFIISGLFFTFDFQLYLALSNPYDSSYGICQAW